HSRLRPRPTAAQLRDLVAAATGTYRITRVRRAVALARDRVESPKETETRLLLLDAGFAEPVINLEVRAPLTGETFRLDLSYPTLRLAIEYDGFWHSTDRVRHRRDRRKDDVLHELGWRVVRASDADIADPQALLGRLRQLRAPLARTTVRLPRPAPRHAEQVTGHVHVTSKNGSEVHVAERSHRADARGN